MFRVTSREYKNYSYTDKTGASVQRSISLDVYLPEGIDCWRNPLLRFSEPHKKPPLGFGGIVERGRVAPLVVWIHPGGFLAGTRKHIPPHLQRAVENHRVVVVIPDYRLCPQVTMIESLTDIRDACEYAIGGALGDQVNTSTWALGGSSAGGWAALLLGLGLHVPNTIGSNSGSTSVTTSGPTQTADLLSEAGLGFPSSVSPPRRRNNTSGSSSGAAGSGSHMRGLDLGEASQGSSRGAQPADTEEGEPSVPTLSRLPRAVFAIYPITDVTREGGACYYEPLKPITWKPSVDAAVGEDGIIDSRKVGPFLVKPGQDLLGGDLTEAELASEEYAGASAVVTSSDPKNDPIRTQLFNYARQEGIYPSLVIPSNLPPERVSIPSLIRAATQASSSATAASASTSHASSSAAASSSTMTSSVSASSLSRALNLPPTFIAWGDADERVPPSQSVDTVKALKAVGAEVSTAIVEGKEHLFDFEQDAEIPGLWRWTVDKMSGLS
ncbi:hypothetical protein OC834_002276 [Tilletia horrida]|nr:hypothetical protein OC834_002276 [Tilletia horrida]KAK0563923.1 hypothetical protein OC844_001972 [Tilletia horrida]